MYSDTCSDSKVDCIQDCCNRCRDDCSGVLQQGEIGLNSGYNKKSRDLQPKNRVGGGSQWMKNYDESMVILAKLT